MDNKLYGIFKPLVMIVLPAGNAIYIMLSPIWEVAALIAVANAILGIFLSISSKRWEISEDTYDGDFIITGNDADTGIPNLQLVIKRDPNELAEKSTILLKSIDQR